MPTLATIVNEIRMDNGEDDGIATANSLIPDANFLDWVIDFYRDLAREVRIEASSETTITPVSGTAEYSLASDWLAFKEQPYYQDSAGNNRSTLEGPVPFTETLVNSATVTGFPTKYYYTETNPRKIGFIPTPDGTGSIKYRHYKSYTAPTATSESFAMPDEFISAFKLYILMRAAGRMKQFGAFNGFKSEFEIAWSKAKVNWRRLNFGQHLSWHR